MQVKRWNKKDRHGPTERWYVENGLKASVVIYRNNLPLQATVWHSDGRVHFQEEFGPEGGLGPGRFTPPWLWGITDQAAPSMPEWMKDDKQWAKALEEAR